MVARLFFIHMKNYFLLLTLLCLSLSARAHDAEVDGIFYNLDADNKTATVTFQGDNYDSYNNEYSGDVVIPETVTYNGITYSVTSLGWACFTYCSSLTSITIPNSVTSLGAWCFSGCSSLTAITIGNSVTSLGHYCFSGCSSLTAIYMLPSTPPRSGNWRYDDTPLETIYVVDEDAKTAYQAHNPWSAYEIVVMPTGIEEVGTDKTAPTIVGYYGLNGKLINGKQRGAVIVRYSDGTTRKVLK